MERMERMDDWWDIGDVPCFNIFRRANDEMYTCSAVSTCGWSPPPPPPMWPPINSRCNALWSIFLGVFVVVVFSLFDCCCLCAFWFFRSILRTLATLKNRLVVVTNFPTSAAPYKPCSFLRFAETSQDFSPFSSIFTAFTPKTTKKITTKSFEKWSVSWLDPSSQQPPLPPLLRTTHASSPHLS